MQLFQKKCNSFAFIFRSFNGNIILAWNKNLLGLNRNLCYIGSLHFSSNFSFLFAKISLWKLGL